VNSITSFALATVTRRTGNEEAEAEFWVAGRTLKYVFEIRPLYSATGRFEGEQTGEITKRVVDASEAGDNFGMKMVFPVRPNTNELEIKLIGYEGDKLRLKTTISVMLRDEPSGCLTRITGD
jgi:hypothetical protein